jgi:regulator of sirC expression with transglutaminase-like and TPR domain
LTDPRLARFAAAVQRPPGVAVSLDEAAFLIGDWDGASIDVDAGRAELDRIAAHAAARVVPPGPWAAPRAIAATLFDDLGFRGNADDYYDPKNSFLSHVLARRTGIPITLSIVYLEVARRIGLTAAGIGFPGHFLVRVWDDTADDIVVDPFHACAILGQSDLRTLLDKFAGPNASLDDALASVTTPQILMRMLLNLAGIYDRTRDESRLIEVLRRLAILDPTNPRIPAELAALRDRLSTLN